jgi:hypothetical protein
MLDFLDTIALTLFAILIPLTIFAGCAILEWAYLKITGEG